MSAGPVVAAELAFNAQGLPWSALYDDIYHPASGRFVQARHVFVDGCQLVPRWRGRQRFVVLETGFGLGNNFLATWDAWRRDPRRCAQLHFVSVEKHPLQGHDLAQAHAGSELGALAEPLVEAWPPLTPDLHRLVFDEGRVQLLLAFGDVGHWLRELVLQADAIFLDGFAPARNPAMWQPRVFKSLARLATPGASLATWTAARAVREGLAEVSFNVTEAQGRGGKRDITLATFMPRVAVRPAPGRATRAVTERRVAIVGGGLAGCATAWALAEQGFSSVVLDQHTAPAQEASGNPGGLFHPIVNAQDGSHARFHRAAAFEAQRAVALAIAGHGVAGSVAGLLRLHDEAGAEVAMQAAMHAVLQRLGLPADVVQALSVEQASQRCGCALPSPVWFFPGGGWVDPAGLSQSFLARAGASSQWRGGVAVQSLRRTVFGWQLLGADGSIVEEAETVVLANAGETLRLLDQPGWPITKVRGQISMLPLDRLPAGLRLPSLPVAGAGYLLPDVAGWALFGASAHAGDDDAEVRAEDHAENLARLAKLCGAPIDVKLADLQGRTAWRWSSADRLPVIGAVPDLDAVAQSAVAASRLEQPRFVPRLPGLFVYTALGSRGITWSALGAQVVAAAISGAPSPVEAALRDAIDPARFVSRAVRRRVAGTTAHQPAQGAG